MAHPTSTTEVENRATSAGFPAIGAVILTLIWGAYTVLVCVEIFSTPMPTL